MLNKEELKNTYIKYEPAITKEIFDKIVTRIDSSYPRANRDRIIDDNFTFGSFKGNYTYLWINEYNGNLCWSLDNHQGSSTKQIQVSDILGEETSSSGIEGHVVEDKSIKMKDYINVKTQEEWDFVSKKLGYNWTDGLFEGNTTCINLSCESYSSHHQYRKGSERYHTFQEWLDLNNYTFNKKEEFKVGDYIILENAGGWGYHPDNNGCLGKITKTTIRADHTSREDLIDYITDVAGDLLNSNTKTKEFSHVPVAFYEGKNIVRKATPEEIQKVTKSNEPNMKKLLKEAKRRYPVGTKYKASNRQYDSDNDNWQLGISTGEFVFALVNINIHITSEIDKSVYFNGKWAEIISLPETTITRETITNSSKEIVQTEFDRNFYVKVNSQEEANQMFDYLESIGEKVGDNYSRKYSNTWKYIIYSKHEKKWLCIGIYDNTIERPLSDFIKPTIKTKYKIGDSVLYKGEETKIVAICNTGINDSFFCIVEYTKGWKSDENMYKLLQGSLGNKLYHYACKYDLELVKSNKSKRYILGFDPADDLIFPDFERKSLKEELIKKEKLVLELVDVPRIKY